MGSHNDILRFHPYIIFPVCLRIESLNHHQEIFGRELNETWSHSSAKTTRNACVCVYASPPFAVSYLQAKSESQVESEKKAFSEDMVWVVHRDGFSLASVVKDSQPKDALHLTINFIRSQVSFFPTFSPFSLPSSLLPSFSPSLPPSLSPFLPPLSLHSLFLL